MKQNKPVSALMQILAQSQSQPVTVNSMTGVTHSTSSTTANHESQAASNPRASLSATTPVVLVYRDLQSYENDRRRMHKSRGSDSGPSKRGGDSTGRDRIERKDGKDDSKQGGQQGKRRRFEGGRQHADFDFSSDREATDAELAGASFLNIGDQEQKFNMTVDDHDSHDAGFRYPFMDDVFKPKHFDPSFDVLRMGDGGYGAERLVLMPADFADLLMDPNKMNSLTLVEAE